MANGIDSSLIERGTRGQEIITAPTLFQQTLPGLFAGSGQVRFDETFGGRLKKFFLGSLGGPTKVERAANEREQTAEKAMINQRTKSIAGSLRVAGRGDVLQFPAARDAVQAAAEGDADAQAAVLSFLGPTKAQRAQGVERQRVTDATAQENLAALELEREGGAFGSNIDQNRFFAIRDKVGTQVAGASSLRNIADTVEQLTDVQMAAIGAGTGGEIQGQIEAELFALMRSMQTLLESGEGSVLRKSDQELIEGALNNPASFRQNVFSREAKTLGSLRRFADILLESAGRELVGLDEKTLGMLAPVMQMKPSPFARPDGPTVSAGETIPEARTRAEKAAASIPTIEQIQGTQLSGPRGPAIDKIEEALQAAPGKLKGELDSIIERFQEAF